MAALFFERLVVRAATIDELLSDDFEALPGQKGDADLAARRLAAWCRSCASGDWHLFERRLARDGLSLAQVLAKLATARHAASAAPAWLADAMWIEAALQSASHAVPDRAAPCAFEHLLVPAVEQAEARLWTCLEASAADNLTEAARGCLRRSLLEGLSSLCAPALYERFAAARQGARTADAARPRQDGANPLYERFVAAMKTGGFRQLFEQKPVLLRLMACLARQWIESSRHLVTRLHADLPAMRRDLLHGPSNSRVAKIEGDLSDPHNGGHSVHIVSFEDGARVVYKPKDLRLDVAWCNLIERLNQSDPPVELRAARAIAADGYGWTEFVDHAGCADQEACKRFFRRAGAWLALFHCFAGTDMHQENMIAAGDHPVPIDLEMMLQVAGEEQKSRDAELQAFEAAMAIVANSVMAVGLLPAFARSPDRNIFAIGGMTSDWIAKSSPAWVDINSDRMRPNKPKATGHRTPNLPHVDGRYARFGDHIDDFVSSFEDYAKFLMRQSWKPGKPGLFEGFAGLPVRKVVRSSRFYYMLLQRLKNHRSMEDGVIWSAQADFLARLSDWEKQSDPLWPLQRAERSALIDLNVPHFVSPSDGNQIGDATGALLRREATSGLEHARARAEKFDGQDIAWQIEVIRQNTSLVSRSNGEPAAPALPRQHLDMAGGAAPNRDVFIAEADKIADLLAGHAIRRGPGAAWIGLDWLGDSEVFQLACLGPDLYNGVAGIAVFLAAHAAVRRRKPSAELALAAMSHLRKDLRGRNARRMARVLGIGAATGLGSIVYALAVMSKCVGDDGLLSDAHAAAELFTDDLIGADKQLDVLSGSAGAILGLLRLYRDSQSADALKRATKCGEHLLGQRRTGAEGRRSWIGQGAAQPLNGISHGAAGFAYALAALAAATGRDEFAQAASECIAFENSSYDAEQANWPDLRSDGEPLWPCQWCHGAPGIGLARIATSKQWLRNGELGERHDCGRLATDIRNALEGVERGWPGHVDTLCCGTLGNIELLCEAADALGRSDLRELASRRLITVLQNAASTGDYRWNAGNSRFNLGLFRGLAGVGYTLLRQVDGSLANVLIWE
jgi:class II lanthipeptide synthase